MNVGRLMVGIVAAAVAMFILGALFWASPLQGLAYGTVPDQQAADLQSAMAASLPETGAYLVPGTGTAQQTAMYGRGPIAAVQYRLEGQPGLSLGSMAGGFALYLVVALLFAAALWAVERELRGFGARARLVAVMAVAAAAYIHLKMPIFLHHGWGHYLYAFVADAATLSAGGLIIARWFLPRDRAAPADAPSEV